MTNIDDIQNPWPDDPNAGQLPTHTPNYTPGAGNVIDAPVDDIKDPWAGETPQQGTYTPGAGNTWGDGPAPAKPTPTPAPNYEPGAGNTY